MAVSVASLALAVSVVLLLPLVPSSRPRPTMFSSSALSPPGHLLPKTQLPPSAVSGKPSSRTSRRPTRMLLTTVSTPMLPLRRRLLSRRRTPRMRTLRAKMPRASSPSRCRTLPADGVLLFYLYLVR